MKELANEGGSEELYMKEEERKNPFVEFQEPAWRDWTCLSQCRRDTFLFCWVNDLTADGND